MFVRTILRHWQLSTLVLLVLGLGKISFALDPGPLPIKTIEDKKLHDQRRNCDLPIIVCYPDNKQVYPLIIFSHGAYGSGISPLPLGQYWASHGYIVILPTHADSLIYLKRDYYNDPWTGSNSLGEYGVPTTQGTWKPIWAERPRDIIFLMNQLDEVERQIAELKQRIDRTRIGVSGHSLGAYTSELVCGTTVDIPEVGKDQSFADPRPKALVMLSPQGRGLQGLRDGSWDKLKLPFLLVTGSYDFGIQQQPPTWRTEPYQFCPPGDKYLMVIQGANHNSYIGHHLPEKDSKMPLQRVEEKDAKLGEAIFADTKMATLRFWDAYLKADAKAKTYLESDQLFTETSGRSKLEHR